MSSSTKKQLRREQVAAKKAEQQKVAQQESKKMKIYTSIFCVILALMVLLVAVVGVNNSGLIEPRVTALKVGETEISASELNMFYINSVTEFVNSAGNYLALYGLRTDLSLEDQVSIDTVNTWDNYFLATAEDEIHYYYSLYNAALADENFTQLEEVLETIQDTMELNEAAYASSNTSLSDVLRNRYGKGVTKETYYRVLEVMTVASEYYTFYSNSLEFTADDIAAKDLEDPVANNLYSYSAYILYAKDYLEGGTEDEEGNVTYSDEENAAAQAACEAVAQSLVNAGYSTTDALEAAVEELPVSENENASSTMLKQEDVRASSITANMKEWITDPARQPGDITYVERVSTINGVTSVAGYNVIVFEGCNTNEFPLVNVRHILVSFEGGTTDEATGTVTYSPAEKEAAKAKAQEIYDAWLAGDADADSFAALAQEKSTDTGSASNGGLYTDVYPDQMVANFNDWCFAEGRQIGDHGMVESEYGWHIIYLDSFSDTTYRSFIIENDMITAALSAWEQEVLTLNALEEKNLSRIDRGLVLGNYIYYGYGN